MRIAIFDYQITEMSPVGRCHLTLLRGLCDTHDFTVFATSFDNPRPDRIAFVRVPLPRLPLAVLFVAFHLMAPLVFLRARLSGTRRFDRVQGVESNCLLNDVAYVHFCHRAFLAEHWHQARPRGLRGVARWGDHWLHALIEPVVLRRCGVIVVPSHGLAAELRRYYPQTAPRIKVIANAVAVDHFRPDPNFDRVAFRRQRGYDTDDVVLCFVALGHFERKGLPCLIAAMTRLAAPQLKLLVVGGTKSTVAAWCREINKRGLGDRVVFAGLQRDVRPFLQAADGFILPSVYEIFPLVGLEAAAANRPLIVTPVHGLSDIVRDGENAIVIEATADSVAAALSAFLGMSAGARDAMGVAAGCSVSVFNEENFVAKWREIYSVAVVSA
ncbi:MAG: glycosyltransferase family 4 protein [Azospirillaceae bacterium]|nr:glycosyltransferase family 4 protein [Azospirillaceae bacterium]